MNNIILKLLEDNNNNYLKILLFNKTYYIKKKKITNHNQNNIDDNKIIKTNYDFYKIIKSELNIDEFRIKYKSKIITNKKINIFLLDNISNLKENNTIFLEIYYPLKGGNPIDDIKNAFQSIADVCLAFAKFLLFVTKMIIWFIRLIIWFSIEFLNPIKIFSDIFGSVNKIVKLIIVTGIDFLIAIFKYFFNIAFGFLFNGTMMGWDQETYKEEKKEKLRKREREIKNKLSGSNDYFSNTEENNKYDKDKCYKTPPGQIPFSIIIMSILCPPLGIFMQYGLSYWLNIVICCLLTLMYYIPGLLYSLILLYC